MNSWPPVIIMIMSDTYRTSSLKGGRQISRSTKCKSPPAHPDPPVSMVNAPPPHNTLSKRIEYPSPRSTVHFSRVFSSITHQADNLQSYLYLLNCHDRTKTPISWLLWYKIIWLCFSENNSSNMFLWSMLTFSWDRCYSW